MPELIPGSSLWAAGIFCLARVGYYLALGRLLKRSYIFGRSIQPFVPADRLVTKNLVTKDRTATYQAAAGQRSSER